MKTYIISYDLSKVTNHSSFIANILSFPEAKQILESTWVVRTNWDVLSIMNELIAYIDEGGLFIIKGSRDAAWSQIQCEDNWLIESLK